MMKHILFLLLAVLSVPTATAFVPKVSSPLGRSACMTPTSTSTPTTTITSTTTTALSERRWNFNEGRAPWGMSKNAEIWNGRVAQMAFTLTFLQELIQGKGVFKGIEEGNPINLAVLAFAGVSTLGLTVFLAIKGDDDYTKETL